MSDPRVDAITGWWYSDSADLGEQDRVEARGILAAVDAADPLLPKVRALFWAAHADRYVENVADLVTAVEAFDEADLARLGITGGSE